MNADYGMLLTVGLILLIVGVPGFLSHWLLMAFGSPAKVKPNKKRLLND